MVGRLAGDVLAVGKAGWMVVLGVCGRRRWAVGGEKSRDDERAEMEGRGGEVRDGGDGSPHGGGRIANS